MVKQQAYSSGLLYSVAPDSFSSLHLMDDDGKSEFDWEAYDAEFSGDSLAQVILSFLKTTATSWNVFKNH